MPFSAKAIANYFLELANASEVPLTPMKVQKLVYYAHGWNLAITGQPLINEQVEAWKFGPVIRSLYNSLKTYGNKAVPGLLESVIIQHDGSVSTRAPTLDEKNDPNRKTRALLDRIWQTYGKLSAVQLSNSTHVDGSPWHQVFEDYKQRQLEVPKGTDIPEAKIKDYFIQLAGR